MHETQNGGNGGNGASRKGLHFNGQIDAGHVMQAVVLVGGIFTLIFTTNARLERLETTDTRLEKIVEMKADKEMMGRAEVELIRRINDQQAANNKSELNIEKGFAEIKAILGDIHRKLDTKADKPGFR